MKHLLTILAIIALFLISCNKNEAAGNSDELLAKTAQSLVKSTPEEGDEEETEVIDEELPGEEEGAEEEETPGEEEEVSGEEEETTDDEEEEPVEEEQTPESIIAAFIAEHFPETALAEGLEGEDGHEVTLEDGTKIIFDSNYEWKRVCCKHSTIYTFVPESIVPEEITAYVSENYPEQTIMDIKKVGFGWMVTLNNKGKIKFNKDFSIK